MADHDHEETFEGQSQSHASATIPQQCSGLRKNGFVVLKSRPCKIVEMSTSKTGKHGHAKVHLVGLDIFTNKKYEDICPSTHNMEVPVVKREDFTLVNLEDEYVSLMSNDGDCREDLKIDPALVGMSLEDIKSLIDNPSDDDKVTPTVTVLSAMGEEIIVDIKPKKGGSK